MTNESLSLTRRRAERRLDSLTRELKDIDSKLSRLYAALERGKVEIDVLAPRLKELRADQRLLKERQDEALDEMRGCGDPQIEISSTQEYVDDLKGLLGSASFMESKTFLGSFIRRVEFGSGEVGIEYTIPSPTGKALDGREIVPNTGRVGSAGWIRTSDPSVNSRLLYH